MKKKLCKLMKILSILNFGYNGILAEEKSSCFKWSYETKSCSHEESKRLFNQEKFNVFNQKNGKIIKENNRKAICCDENFDSCDREKCGNKDSFWEIVCRENSDNCGEKVCESLASGSAGLCTSAFYYS
jgi:hypothetical protein